MSKHVSLVSFCQRANLSIVKELGDKAAQGRTYGNLGNTYYLLGEFEKAVAAHEKVSGSLVNSLLQHLKKLAYREQYCYLANTNTMRDFDRVLFLLHIQ